MQPEAEAFLQRIRASPDDDTPRLIYADWLEEQGILDAPEWGPRRARLIRIQIALARLQEDESEVDEPDPAARAERRRTREKLIEAQEDLLRAHREDWTIAFRGLADGLEFRRGFVEKLNIAARQWLRRASELFAAAPIRHVQLLDVGGNLPSALQSPYLSRLAALTIQKQHSGRPLSRAVAEATHLSHLKALYLIRQRFEDGSAEDLATSPVLANLETLDLSENELGETAARSLANSAHFGKLRRLELGNNRLGPTGAEIIAGSERLAALHYLGLSSNELGTARLQFLTRAHDLLRVPILNLSGNHLTAAGLQVILTQPAPPAESGGIRLTELDLSNNELGNDGASVLAACPHLAGLRVLRLASCGISDHQGARALAVSPYLNNLITLDLGHNPINEAGYRAFLNTSEMQSLRHLIFTAHGVTNRLQSALEMHFRQR